VTTFLIVCAVMIVAALALVLVPLLRNEPAGAKGEKPVPRSVPLAVVLMLLLPLGATLFYGATSNFPWDNAGAATAGGHAQTGGSVDEMLAQLQERLAKNPADMEGWRMLGRTYLIAGQFAQAVDAYEKANSIAGGQDMALQLDLAEALVLTERPDQQERAKQIIEAALATEPGNQKALWYQGVMAMRSGDKQTAITNFSKLLEQNPPDEIRQILVAQLSELGALPAGAGQPPADMGGPMSGGMGGGMGGAAGNVEPTGRTIRVAVSVDPALAGKLKPGTTVFVSAREPGIPGPPIAAVRLSSDDLPTTVVLSDANSMIEGRNLSSVDQVQVVARVAFGGTAVPASGDLVGEVVQGKGASPDVNLVISRAMP
jgi:cytochrome c-type biogenesis protein CcmH